ncbi:cytochrome b/b6 domain-containing protein, partial [Streptomyces sp. NPDC058964]
QVASRWRAMHMLAYPAWCLALLHGLYAGRAAKPLFTVLYALSVLGVMAALALRAAPRPVKRGVAARIAALLGTEERVAREELEESRLRATAAALPGYGSGGGGAAPGPPAPPGPARHVAGAAGGPPPPRGAARPGPRSAPSRRGRPAPVRRLRSPRG